MVQTPSTMLPLGTPVPPFDLRDVVSGRNVTSTDFSGDPALLVMFICNHCPFVKHVIDELGSVAEDYAPRGVSITAINSNDVESHPDDAPEHMREMARAKGWTFPFLMDDTQEVAKAFRAACTPDFFVFGRNGRLGYRGQLDDARPGNGRPVTGVDLRAALDAVLAGKPAPEPQIPSVGCNIKWKPANEPDYFRG